MPLATSWSDVRISALFFARRSALDSLPTTTREIHTLGAAGTSRRNADRHTRRLVRSLAPESHEVNRRFGALYRTLVFDEPIFVLRAQTAPRLQFRRASICVTTRARVSRCWDPRQVAVEDDPLTPVETTSSKRVRCSLQEEPDGRFTPRSGGCYKRHHRKFPDDVEQRNPQ
jgi:hypothetical protein